MCWFSFLNSEINTFFSGLWGSRKMSFFQVFKKPDVEESAGECLPKVFLTASSLLTLRIECSVLHVVMLIGY